MERGQEPSPTGLLEGQTGGGTTEGTAAATDGEELTPSSDGDKVPQRADGLTLIGEFEQSGFEDPPSLARRKDGQVVQLTELLYLTLEAVDGRRNLDGIAAELSRRLGRTATAENVEFLLEEKLRPLGVLKNPDGSEPPLKKANPLLALRWKFVLSGENLTNRLTAPFATLFRSPIVLAVLAGFLAVSGWVLFVRGMAQGTRQALYSPGLLLLIFVLTVFSAAFHEFGHAAACRYGGGRPGAMGAGIYLVWPAFYTDVTDAYRLDRRGRLRTALGGLYFNALFILATFAAWAITGSEAFLLFVPIQLFQMIHQLLPVVRMDGYYILSDLTGVPDLFARIKPTLNAAVPGKEADQRALQLKRWVRVTVTVWVAVVIPLLLFSVAMAAISLPRVVTTAWNSVSRQGELIGRQATEGRWLGVGVGVVAMIALITPLAGSVCILGRTVRRSATRVWKATAGRPVWRSAAIGGAALAAAGLAVLWWPNGEYQPIRPGETGTLTQGVKAVGHVATGRPAVSPEDVGQPLGEIPDTPGPGPAVESPDDAVEPTPTTVGTQQDAPDTTKPRVSTTLAVPTTIKPDSDPAPTVAPEPATPDEEGEPTP